MTTDAGMAQIASGYAPPAGPGLGVDVDASLAVQVGGLLTEMKQERATRALFQQKMAQALRDTPLLSVTLPAGAPQTFASEDWVCKTGYTWFAQLITAKNLGSTDTLWIYRTSASGQQQIVDSSAKWLLTNAAPAWTPGRTGLRLGPGDGLTLQGTTTQNVTVNIDVVILETWLEPDFLL